MSRGRVVVLGAGIAGLAAAKSLVDHADVTILDAAPAAGGKVRTGTFRNRALDFGPDAFVARQPAARNLAIELGLGDDLVAPAAGRAGIFSAGALHLFPERLVLGIPTDLRALDRSGCLPHHQVLRAATDLLRIRRVLRSGAVPDDGEGQIDDGARVDPSVARVLRGRLGPGVFDFLVDPLISGINAGDSSELSLASAAPALASALAERRSVIRAVKHAPSTARPPGEPVFYGLSGGLGTLVERLVARLASSGAHFVFDAPLEAIVLGRGTGHPDAPWEVVAGGVKYPADGLVLAIPSAPLAPFVAELDGDLAKACAAIPRAGVVTVTLAYERGAFKPDLGLGLGGGADPRERLAGVLVGRGAHKLLSAVTLTSEKWPTANDRGELLVRASLGRYRDDRALALDDDELLRTVRAELAEVINVRAAPLESHVERFPSSFPQYTPGHGGRVATIERRVRTHPALALCGASYHGIGIPSCIESGTRAGASVAAALAR